MCSGCHCARLTRAETPIVTQLRNDTVAKGKQRHADPGFPNGIDWYSPDDTMGRLTEEFPFDELLLLSLLIAEAEQVSANPSTNIARRADCTIKSRLLLRRNDDRHFSSSFRDQGQGLAPKATYTHTRNFTFSRTGLARGRLLQWNWVTKTQLDYVFLRKCQCRP